MTLKKNYLEHDYRIALVMDLSSSIGHRMMAGLCRRATAYPHLAIRRYFVDTLAEESIDPLVEWKPDALITLCGHTILLKNLLNTLPNIPVVSMTMVNHDLVDAVVVGNVTEQTGLALDHFRSNGLTHYALFFPGGLKSAKITAEAMQELLQNKPGTLSNFQYYIDLEDLLQAPQGDALQHVGAWLESLPKPVGIYCPTMHSAAYLIRVCRHLGLAVPDDIQIIGDAGIEETLECLPHLTSVHSPAERIGTTALKTAVSLLQGSVMETKIQRVSGASLIPQGSTGIIPSLLSDIPVAIAYIESHATQGITVDDVLSKTQNVSRMTFYREFKEATGDSPAHYIRRIRIEAACRLLATTQLDITRIAELAGFSGSNYFAQVFRRETGMTPNQYRKSQPEKA